MHIKHRVVFLASQNGVDVYAMHTAVAIISVRSVLVAACSELV